MIDRVGELVKRHGRWLGTLLSIAALIAFAYGFANAVDLQSLPVLISQNSTALAVGLLLYLCAHAMMCTAWVVLARRCGATATTLSLSHVLLVSQIAKYLPGNVGHLFGRVLLAKRAGMTLPQSGSALTLEIAAILIAAALLAVSSALFLPQGLLTGAAALAPALALGLAVSLLCAFYYIQRKNASWPKRIETALGIAVILVTANYIAVILAQSQLLGVSLSDTTILTRVVAAVTFSWLLGLVFPGAPAGLGLREVSMLSLLHGIAPQPEIAFAVAAMRLVTMSGDVIAFSVGLVLRKVDTNLPVQLA